MGGIRSRVVLWFALVALWLILAGTVDLQEVVVGALVAALITVLPLPGGAVFAAVPLAPKRVLYAIAYLGVFLWAVVKSNLDVAFRVLHPRLPINPGIVRVRTRLTSPLGRLVLANSITLTPGTITVDAHENELSIHWISVDSPDIEAATQKIVGGFERYLEVIFG